MMRKVVLFIVLLALPVLLIAQTRTVVIDWNEKETSAFSVTEKAKLNKVVKDRNFSSSLSFNKERLMYVHQWEDSRYANPRSARISSVSLTALSPNELNKIDKNSVPGAIKYELRSTKGREKVFTIFTLVPVINDNGIYKKVNSFTISYTYETQNQGGRSIPLSNSVLANGSWYKFKIEKTGIHRIDKSFLNDLGMNTDGIDPRTLRIYGHGGKSLPFENSLNTEYDLPENAIQVVGEADGSFDNGDFILFYGVSTIGYDEQNKTNINPYSDDTYYYITAGGTNGRRVQPMVEPSGSGIVINRFDDYKFHEVDEITPAKVGRRWFGNRFDIESEQSYEFMFPNIISGSKMSVDIKLAAASEVPTSMAVTINGTSIDPIEFIKINDPKLLDSRDFVGEIPAAGETVTIDLAYNNAGNPSSIGYIDYIRIGAQRQLTGTEGQMAFRFNDAATQTGVGEYQLAGAAQFSQVWDVTNKESISAKVNENNAGVFSFKAFMGEVREYVAVNPNDYFTPVKGPQTIVGNQDIKGTIFNDASGNFQDIDFLIITAPFLIQPALRLAAHRKEVDGINVKVVTTDKIYEEFSSGRQDITAIRNFVKYVYDNATSPAKRLKYVCMFGDASVDYKDRISNNNNIVPIYHKYESQSTFSSYMSDEYYVMMDPDDGTMEFTDKSDIATGRILADEVGLANILVSKIIDYASKASYGNWRNNFVLISDDADTRSDYRLQEELDELGDEISFEKQFINVKKIHSDAFQQQTSAGGDRYPEVNDAIDNAIEVGALVVNYFGHGGEDGLAQEFIYTKGQAQDLRNPDRYSCVITVTCEFTKFDDPQRITAGELTYWNSQGGAVAMITTTRSITVGTGVDYNKKLASELFGYGTDNILPPAEALRIARNDITSSDKYVVFYIGDPSMHLAFPKQKVKLTTLNDIPIAQATDTLKALSKVKIGGEIVDSAGNIQSNYNGILEGKVYDKNVQRQTLGNDGTTDVNGVPLIFNFITLGEILFNGQATVSNGKFEFEFVVPRDVQIPVGKGRVSFYAQKNNELEDHTGVNLNLMIGGLNENAPEDNQGPLISLFMNDESFVSGGITNDAPILIAKLEDENGINTASGIGHDIIAILDGDEANPIVLNEYYQAEVDDYTKGETIYRLRDLEEGLHTLTLRAWDVYNNSSTMDIQFIVAGNDSLEITRVLNYPNPFVNYTEFWFNHNRPFEPLEVQVQVFTVTGKVVWTKNQIINTDGFLSRDIIWDGRDDFGDKIGKGVYIYKITVKSTLTDHQIEKFEKLVIL